MRRAGRVRGRPRPSARRGARPCGGCAQVHPRKLAEAFVREGVALGGRVVEGTVCGLDLAAPSPRVSAVRLSDGRVLPADVAVIALGPWTGAARAWLPSLPLITGQKTYSVRLQPRQPVPADALFVMYRDAMGRHLVRPRPTRVCLGLGLRLGGGRRRAVRLPSRAAPRCSLGGRAPAWPGSRNLPAPRRRGLCVRPEYDGAAAGERGRCHRAPRAMRGAV